MTDWKTEMINSVGEIVEFIELNRDTEGSVILDSLLQLIAEVDEDYSADEEKTKAFYRNIDDILDTQNIYVDTDYIQIEKLGVDNREIEYEMEDDYER